MAKYGYSCSGANGKGIRADETRTIDEAITKVYYEYVSMYQHTRADR